MFSNLRSTYAENVALPAFAAACHAAAPCCCGSCSAAIDRYLTPAGPTAANPPHAAAAAGNGTDGRTETVPFHWPFRFDVDRSSNDLRAVLIFVHLTCYFVVWPTMSCFADWSKRRHVTLIKVEWSTRDGQPCVITMINGHVTVYHYNDTRSRDIH